MSRRRKRGSIAEQFVMHSREMRSSPAWCGLPDNARRVLDRLELEHMQHGGAENGLLKCTYTDFERCGIRRQSVSLAILQAVELGFLRVSVEGGQSISGFRWPSQYLLTYLNGCGRSPEATHDWRAIKSDADADAALMLAGVKRKRRAADRKIRKAGGKNATPAEGAEMHLNQTNPRCESAPTVPGAKSHPQSISRPGAQRTRRAA